MSATNRNAAIERRGLLLSVFGALAMAALGLGFFFVTNSAAVLLDGLFSLIGFVVSMIAMRAAPWCNNPMMSVSTSATQPTNRCST